MFDLDRWKEIIHTLKSNKVRTFLTAFGVFWGIFMLVIMVGTGNGLHNLIKGQLGDFATNSAFMWGRRTTKPFAGFNKGRLIQLRNSDIAAINQHVAGLDVIAPRLSEYNITALYGKNSTTFQIYGDYPEWNLINPMDITSGRFINNIDIIQKRKVTVIGNRVRELLFEKDEDPLNKYIQIKGVYYKVVGVYKDIATGINFGGDGEREKLIYIPFTTMQHVYNYGDIVEEFAITAKQNVLVSSIENEIITLLKRRHKIAPDDDRAIGYFNLENEFQKIRGLFWGINLLICIVGIGTLMAGAIGVSNIMLVVVRERTNELGIRRAVGASSMSVLSQVLWESIILTLSAGWAGLVCGVGILQLFENAIGAKPQISFNVSLLALAILVVSGIFAGLLPAIRAVKMKPIDALRINN